MARKKNNTQEAEELDPMPEVAEEPVGTPAALETQEIPVMAETVPAKEPPVQPVQAAPAPSAPDTPKAPKAPMAAVPTKKRVRIRPSQKKKLSVAVLCTNPLTRRFI